MRVERVEVSEWIQIGDPAQVAVTGWSWESWRDWPIVSADGVFAGSVMIK